MAQRKENPEYIRTAKETKIQRQNDNYDSKNTRIYSCFMKIPGPCIYEILTKNYGVTLRGNTCVTSPIPFAAPSRKSNL